MRAYRQRRWTKPQRFPKNIPARETYSPPPFIIDCRIQKNGGISHEYHYRHRPRLLRHQNSPLLVPGWTDKLRRTRTLPRQGLLEFGGCFFVCGTGRQPIQRDKTVNDNYYLLTLAAIAKEIQQRGLPPECSVRIAAGLPLTSFGRDKPKFRDYLLRSRQPVNFNFEGVEYSITIEEVAIFPQGYAALMTETGLLQDEPSMLLMDLGGWTVDLMRIDNAIPVADTAHSLELGMIRCVDDIREQVRRETGLSLTDAQIENMLEGQPCTVSETVRDIVNRQGRKYTEHLLSATMESGFDLHAIPAVLLGGGAPVVSRHLSPKDGLCKTIFLLDDKVNTVGFERALAAVSHRQNEA